MEINLKDDRNYAQRIEELKRAIVWQYQCKAMAESKSEVQSIEAKIKSLYNQIAAIEKLDNEE